MITGFLRLSLFSFIGILCCMRVANAIGTLIIDQTQAHPNIDGQKVIGTLTLHSQTGHPDAPFNIPAQNQSAPFQLQKDTLTMALTINDTINKAQPLTVPCSSPGPTINVQENTQLMAEVSYNYN